MARDARQLRLEASEATASGKYKRALAAYLELETLEPRDAQWPKRAGETYRRIGRVTDAIEAFSRAADRYAQGGFLVQAIAVCKVVLQIDPRHSATLQKIAAMNEQIGAGPTRAIAIAENNPNLADNAAVTALKRGTTGMVPVVDDLPMPGMSPPASARTTTPNHGLSLPRTRTANAQSQLAMARTKSRSVTLPPNQGIDAIDLKTEIPEAFEREDNSGVFVIPIDDEDYHQLVIDDPGKSPTGGEPASGPVAALPAAIPHTFVPARTITPPVIEIDPGEPDGEILDESTDENTPVEPMAPVHAPPAARPPPGAHHYLDSPTVIPGGDGSSGAIHVAALAATAAGAGRGSSGELSVTELSLADLEEIPLPEVRAVGQAAAEALASTPLFSGLSQEALESLVEELRLIKLVAGEALFHEGDPGDALYVIVEGEVSALANGTPLADVGHLGPGQFLGEVALLTDQPRMATVTAIGDAELLRIDRATLSRVLAAHGDVLTAVLRFVRERLVDRWTRTSPLFHMLEPSDRNDLASRFKFLEIADGSRLLSAGERPNGLYIVLAGGFAVSRNGSDVAALGPGDLIGEAALLSSRPVASDVTARGKSLALCLPAGDFRELIMTHPHVLEYVGELAEHSRRLQIL